MGRNAWHFLPFTEGAQYGIELFYPFKNELRVSTQQGRMVLDGDFGPDPDNGLLWPPFRTFGTDFYTYQILLDLKVGEGFAIMIQPHPRFYTDPTDSVPIAVPALLRRRWPLMSFIVFKAPSEARTHIFRPGEPLAQVLVVPAEPDFELAEMNEVKRRPPNANCNLGGFTRAAPPYLQTRIGPPRQTRCLMAAYFLAFPAFAAMLVIPLITSY